MSAPDRAIAPAGSVVVPGPLAAPWMFVHDDVRPHLHPVTTPAGHVLTCDGPADNPEHHALWFTIEHVDGDTFGVGGGGELRIIAGPVEAESSAGPSVGADIDWVRPGSDDVAIEQSLRFTPVEHADPSWSVVDIRTILIARRDAVLDRTPSTTGGGCGGLTFRGRADLVDTTFLLADGSTASELVGTRSPWVDLTGTVPEPLHHGVTATIGIAILDGSSPGGPPVPWYGSTRSKVDGTDGWSNVLNAAFLWEGPMTLRPGDPLDLRYRVIAHDGPVDSAALDAEHARYRLTLDS